MRWPDLRWPEKQPGEVLDYGLNWTPLLAGGTIVSSEWEIDQDTVTIETQTFGPANTTIWLSGGIHQTDYIFTNRVTDSAGRTMELEVSLYVREIP